MQGLVNFTTAIADGIAVLSARVLLSGGVRLFLLLCLDAVDLVGAALALSPSSSSSKPWMPFVSLVLCGVFASFPKFLTMANVSAGTNLGVGLTTYAGDDTAEREQRAGHYA